METDAIRGPWLTEIVAFTRALATPAPTPVT
jgi:hypothetical protein